MGASIAQTPTSDCAGRLWRLAREDIRYKTPGGEVESHTIQVASDAASANAKQNDVFVRKVRLYLLLMMAFKLPDLRTKTC